MKKSPYISPELTVYTFVVQTYMAYDLENSISANYNGGEAGFMNDYE